MLIGWLLRSTAAERRERDLQARCEKQLLLRDQQLATHTRELTHARNRADELQTQLGESLAITHKLEHEIGTQVGTITHLTEQVNNLQTIVADEAEAARETQQAQKAWIEQLQAKIHDERGLREADRAKAAADKTLWSEREAQLQKTTTSRQDRPGQGNESTAQRSRAPQKQLRGRTGREGRRTGTADDRPHRPAKQAQLVRSGIAGRDCRA